VAGRLPELRPVLLRYHAEATELAIRLVRAFVAALGLAEDALEALYTPEPGQLIKIIRYPGRDETESEQGVGPHKDGGLVTVLLQDMQGGLEIETEDGWIGALPVPGTFVVNIGELLELAANGYLRATVHRAVTPPVGADRLSVAFFFGARLDATVRCWHCRPSSSAKHGASPKIGSIRSSMRSAGIL
jgi:isopenicillin N synthase-like dioxygenase